MEILTHVGLLPASSADMRAFISWVVIPVIPGHSFGGYMYVHWASTWLPLLSTYSFLFFFFFFFFFFFHHSFLSPIFVLSCGYQDSTESKT